MKVKGLVKTRFFASLRMTKSEGLRMTVGYCFRVKTNNEGMLVTQYAPDKHKSPAMRVRPAIWFRIDDFIASCGYIGIGMRYPVAIVGRA